MTRACTLAAERQLELAAQVESSLRGFPSVREPADSQTPVFKINVEDGQAVSGCNRGNERAFLQWLVSGLYRVLEPRGDDQDESTVALESIKTFLLNGEPKSPLESIILGQLLTTQQLAASFGRRALRADDSEIASKFAVRYSQLIETSCRQAETLMRLRGEGGKQTMVVHHLTVEPGAKAVVGQVNNVPALPGDGGQS